MGDATDVLRHQRSGCVEQRAAVVAHLVDHHVVGRALQIVGHLVGDRRHCIPDDLERHRIEAIAHVSTDNVHGTAPTWMMISPVSDILARSPANMTVVEPYSSIRAGPTIAVPAASISRA